jgi:prepilin-type N-terminal cleavage/methylation domain-containing protein
MQFAVLQPRNRNSCNRNRCVRSGFTLLELIFALLMVAMIIPMLMASLVGDYKLKSTALAAIEPPTTAEQAFDWLRIDLGDAVAPSAIAAANNTPTLLGPFEGQPGSDDKGHRADDLVFFGVADSPQHADGNGEIKMIELTVMTTPEGDHVLVRKVTRDLISYLNGSPPNPDVEVLCRGVDGFALDYFDGSNWVAQTWDSTAEDNTIPAAVRVTLTLTRPDAAGKSTRSLNYSTVIALPCSTAPYDSTVNTGNLQ